MIFAAVIIAALKLAGVLYVSWGWIVFLLALGIILSSMEGA